MGTVLEANTGASTKSPPTRASTRKNVAIWSPANASSGDTAAQPAVMAGICL